MNIYENFFNSIEDKIISDLPLLDSMRSMRKLKEDNSFVTEADFYVQQLVLDSISSLDIKMTLVSEEIQYDVKEINLMDPILVLDPLDGTENFTSGLPEWGVGISIFCNNEHQASCMLLPELNKKLMTGQQISYFTSRIKGLSSSLSTEGLSSLKNNNEYRIMGCSMYNLYNVIRGSYASYENIGGVNSWDILPGINIALEHDYQVEVNEQRYAGQFLQPDQKYRVKVYR